LGFGVWGLGLRDYRVAQAVRVVGGDHREVYKLACTAPHSHLFVCGVWFRVSGSRFRVSGSGFRVSGSWFRASGLGFRVPGLRRQVLGFEDRVHEVNSRVV
jgi:hypothetical protein